MEEQQKGGAQSSDEAIKQVTGFIVEQMQAGADKSTIANKLVENGMDRGKAMELVEAIYNHILEEVEKEKLEPSSLVMALIAGGAAAAVGGGLWGLIAILTEHEIGFVAWGLGWLAGIAVVLFTGGKKGIPLQIIVTVSSLAGIVVGKYITFYHFLKKALIEEHGEELASKITMFSSEIIKLFVDNFSEMLGGFDILWVILAVITAWRIPKGLGIKLPEGRFPMSGRPGPMPGPQGPQLGGK